MIYVRNPIHIQWEVSIFHFITRNNTHCHGVFKIEIKISSF